ncbi:class III lanthionine synthetase LanKC [Microbispora sp. RL4-1S]|uniref:non-specific serine/threonine protein kinase n=1 Tax=Microbispora oryzae TaxID=2806554 RepID=A0A941AH26_9ACTN|nr:class III lanthionine synthetase LanKC [Microbispora oryzae]MBP2703615.1 class III lanthionine synthetase LanKC [Microbispora oryzae]
MISKYEIYCLADPLFYDTLDSKRVEHPDFSVTERPVPDGWAHLATDTWMHYAPAGVTLPTQGWKIHISSRVEDAERVIAAAWDYCVPRGLAFKYLRGARVMLMQNSKYASRGASGKLVTVYPFDEAQLELVLKELAEILDGVEGPYILSDLRYGDGPLFVRYGGFAERHCAGENGEQVLAIEDPDGRLVPDVRGPGFALPPWVPLPAFLEPHLAARNAVTLEGLPYQVESVLHFSNGGGVYLGRDVRTGERVVLKEARPHAGLDTAGRDAVTRLRHEADIMERLAGLDAVPAALDYFTLGDHHFLVQEYVDGATLSQLIAQKHPLTRADVTPEMVAGYTDWAVAMLARVRRAVADLHGRGVVFGDLHPFNILVDGERVVLIDFEVSSLAEERRRPTLANPGFVPPPDRLGVEADEYALACLHLGMFAPMSTMLLPLHRPKAVQLARLITETFPAPAPLMAGAVRTLLGREPEPEPSLLSRPWPELREAIATAILAAATPGRTDRLFPGDIVQFEPGGGVSLANGAAGVLYALAVTGAGRFPEHEEWLAGRAARAGAGIGFYNGLHGVAYALLALDRRRDALDVAELCGRQDWAGLDLSLYRGLSGVALSLMHLHGATGETAFRDEAERVVQAVADRLGGAGDVPEISGGVHPHAGLMYGSSGPALMFLHAYERCGDTRFLDLAATALRQDLRRCVTREDGQLQVQQGWRTNPYLDEGSAGIGLVLDRFLTHRHEDDLAAASDAIRPVMSLPYYIQSGLFAGRAGMIAGLATGSRPDRRAAGEHIALLGWHELPYGGGLAFPGAQLLRLSTDFATGSAGVLFALGTVLHDQPVSLPFLEPPDGPRRRGPCAPPPGHLSRPAPEGGVRNGAPRPADP